MDHTIIDLSPLNPVRVVENYTVTRIHDGVLARALAKPTPSRVVTLRTIAGGKPFDLSGLEVFVGVEEVVEFADGSLIACVSVDEFAGTGQDGQIRTRFYELTKRA